MIYFRLQWGRCRSIHLLLTALVSMGLVVLFKVQDWTPDQGVFREDRSLDDFGLHMGSSPLTPVDGSKTLLINAFYEHRTANASVRMIAIVWRAEKTQHRCLLTCFDGQLVTVPALRTAHNTHFWFPYGTGDFLCRVPAGCQPRYAALLSEDMDLSNVSVVPVYNQAARQDDFSLNFTVCLSTMFNRYNNVLQFIQAMELYRMLGAQKVVVYKNSCSPIMEKVLRYYSDQVGLLEVLPWPVDAHIKVSSSWQAAESPGDLHYYGQIPALNDCVYRYMYQTKYLLLHDPDEVILPTGNASWAQMLTTLQRKHGDVNFYFENNVFPLEERETESSYNRPEWSHLPGENFLLHLLREPIPKFHYHTGKGIVNPRTVLQMSVHTVEKLVTGARQVEIGPELGKLFHIRRRKNAKSNLVRDEGLLILASRLVREVNAALGKMNLPDQKAP